jgi:hypothetical protein
MPYAPGIQDISGQLIGEGMTRASNIRAQARSDFGKTIADTLVGGIQQYQQNENFNKQSLAKFTGMMQDPDFKQYVNSMLADENNTMGVPESVRTSLTNAQVGKLKSNDSAVLATIAQDFSERKRVNQEQDQKKAQTALLFAQEANQKAAAEETNLKIQAMRSAQADLAKFDTGNLSAAPSRPMVPQGISQFGNVESLALPQTSFDPRSNPIIAASLAQQQPAGRLISAIDSDELNRQAKRAQLEYRASTGLLKPLDTFIGDILKRNKEARAEETANRAAARAQQVSSAEMTQPEAMAKIEILKKQYPDSNFTAQPGTNAASYVIKEEMKPDPLEKQKVIAFEAEMKPAIIGLNAVSANAETARNDLPRQQRIFEALKEQAVTGYGAPLSIKARSMLSGTGLINKKQLGKDQVFAADLALDALTKTKQLLDGQGSVSNAERDRVDQISLNIEKDPSAIFELMKIHEAATKRAIAAEEHRSMLYDKTKRDDPYRLIDINESMKKWYQKNTLTDFAKSDSQKFAEDIERKAKDKKP